MPRQLSYDDDRLAAARSLSASQGGVLSRRQLYELGITRWEIRGQVRAHRWQLVGDQTIHLTNGPLSAAAERWAAVIQGGPRACLDGGSALIAAGLERYDLDRVRVSVPKGTRVRRTRRFDIRETRRWEASDVVRVGIPRTRPATAAVRAALWARTDREASYVLMATVQQRLTTAEAIGVELLRIRRDKRRLLLHALLNELLDGAQTLGEIDVGVLLRRRGLPPPIRQALRRDRNGRYYLDLYWPDYRLVVEIDGIHHGWAENVVGDALRQNTLALDGDTVLRIPMLGLRLQPDAFLDQIESGLRTGGWAAAA